MPRGHTRRASTEASARGPSPLALAERSSVHGAARGPSSRPLRVLPASAGSAGLPPKLSAGIAHLSGVDVSDVRVAYNSSEPSRLGAVAYAQGRQIFLAPGGEAQLPHEAWHIVQQRQGRVQSMGQIAGIPINEDVALEREATDMGAKALLAPPATRAEGASPASQAGTAAGDAAPAQLYRTLGSGDEYRISNAGNMAVLPNKGLWATRKKITESARALKEARAIVQVEEHPQGHPVTPARKELYMVKVSLDESVEIPEESHHRKFAATNRGGVIHMSWADCHRTAQTIMGSPVSYGGGERPVVKDHDEGEGDKVLMPLESGKRGGFGSDAQGNRGIYAMFAYALPRFLEYLKNEEPVVYEQYFATLHKRWNRESDGQRIPTMWSIHRGIIDRGLAERFSEMFGINEFARPQVGDALAQVSNEPIATEMKATREKLEKALELGSSSLKELEEAPGFDDALAKEKVNKADLREYWNFHWAGVIMSDANDYVVLQNLSVENMQALNYRWTFQMYGSGNQSFHTEAGRDPHATLDPVTSVFRYVPTAAPKDIKGTPVETKGKQGLDAMLGRKLKKIGAQPP